MNTLGFMQTRVNVLASVLGCLIGICTTPARAQEFAEGEKLFALKIQRLLSEKCLACHGNDSEDLQGGLDLRSRAAMLQGGDSFETEVVITGDGRHSYLYLVTTREEEGYEMPPKEAEQLTEEETWWIRDWIDSGAPWPSPERTAKIQAKYAEGVIVPTSGGLNDEWTNRRYQPKDLWAYQPRKYTQPPANTHPIDWFIERKLQAEFSGVEQPTIQDASASELARRISIGVTGLPPIAHRNGQIDFEKFKLEYTTSPQSTVDRLAEQLLSSPHYGEQFGQRWLDVTRYADTAGFANDYARPNAWRYRDYVVRSFNEDKPYDEFVSEQIAGDEIAPDDPEKRIATGFLRMGPWEQTSMSVFRVTRVQWLDDVTDSVGQTFLAHALQCCKCHDHKFDPLPTRDYYSMMAVFSTTQFAEPEVPFMTNENKSHFESAATWTRAKIAAYQQQATALQKKIDSQKTDEKGNAKVGDNGLDPGDENSLARMRKNIARHKWELEKTQPIAFSVYTGKTITRNNVGARIKPPAKPWGKGNIEEDTILEGGDVYSRGDPVRPGPLSAAMHLGNMEAAEFPSESKGRRRLALAKWITDPQNPLTARVMVNRVWSWHFGKGLAGNPNNFGATGKPPTHPELLDFLADWFIKNDWSIKQLNKLILTSRTYRRSSRLIEPNANREELEELYALAPIRRLTAEEFRDTMLAVSGELNPAVGGIPCHPDINQEVATQPRQIMGGTASVYEPDALPKTRNRRTLYTEKIRGLRDPFLETFNQPGPDKSCELRETSTIAPQALTLMNATELQDRALAFAQRLLEESEKKSDREVIESAFGSALGRPATEAEVLACIEHWRSAVAADVDPVISPESQYPAELLRTVMAEKTGEPYQFVEKLPGSKDYVPDLQPHQVDARTRGLAQVCLVLMNSNEFAYLD